MPTYTLYLLNYFRVHIFDYCLALYIFLNPIVTYVIILLCLVVVSISLELIV